MPDRFGVQFCLLGGPCAFGVFKSGKQGFFGKVMNPATGDRYQIVGAVKIG